MLESGTRVRIHNHWHPNSPVAPKMNRFLGKTMTILDRVDFHFYTMVEDGGDGPKFQDGHWHFHVNDFDVIDAVGDADTGLFVAPTDQDFLRFFGIGGE